MKKVIKKYFIPHKENGFHPHILHTKRVFHYATFFVFIKAILVLFVIFLPLEVFTFPEVVEEQHKKIVALTNEVRAKNGVAPLKNQKKLEMSALVKTDDMASERLFSHVGLQGKDLKYYLKLTDYRYMIAGENLAMGFLTPEEVVSAWEKSPSHYANLIEDDFMDVGIGLSVGLYKDIPVTYVAQHFGTEKGKMKKISLSANTDKNVDTKKTIPKQVRGVRLYDVPFTVDVENSFVRWSEGEKTVTVVSEVALQGEISEIGSVSIVVNEFMIPLQKNQKDIFTGSVEINESADDFFKITLNPSVLISMKNGDQFTAGLAWESVKISKPSTLTKYNLAKQTFAGFTALFKVADAVYMFFLVFFSVALALMIFVEIKIQHHRVIGQTALLIGLLICMLII